MNLFLGQYIPDQHQVPLWDMDDSVLHQKKSKRLEFNWWKDPVGVFRSQLVIADDFKSSLAAIP